MDLDFFYEKSDNDDEQLRLGKIALTPHCKIIITNLTFASLKVIKRQKVRGRFFFIPIAWIPLQCTKCAAHLDDLHSLTDACIDEDRHQVNLQGVTVQRGAFIEDKTGDDFIVDTDHCAYVFCQTPHSIPVMMRETLEKYTQATNTNGSIWSGLIEGVKS